MKTLLGVAGTALLALALSGCGTTTTETVPTTTTTAPTPTTYYGQDAAAIAALISDCDSIKAGDVGRGGPDMTSTASCVLGGRTVDFYAWQAAGSGPEGVLAANKAEVYYAAGTGWTAHVRRDRTLFWQLSNDAGNLSRHASAQPSPTAPDLPGEKITSETIATALGGRVVHTK